MPSFGLNTISIRHYKYVDEWEAEQVIGHHHGFVIPKGYALYLQGKTATICLPIGIGYIAIVVMDSLLCDRHAMNKCIRKTVDEPKLHLL